MGLMDLFQQGDMREKLYDAASRSNVPQGGLTGALFKAMFPHGAGNALFGRQPEPMPAFSSPDGTQYMADLASNMAVPGTFIGAKGMMNLLGRDVAADILTKADDALKSGTPKELIFNDLGVFRGPDKKWRYEIDDSGMAFRDGVHEKMRGGNVPGVGDVIQHDELLRAYPQIADHGFEYSASMHGAGSYDPAREVVTINPMLDGQKSTTLHELQHAVQQIEDFAKGGDPVAMTSPGFGEMPVEFKTKSGTTVRNRGGDAYFIFPDGKFQRITPDTAWKVWKEEGAPTAFQQYLDLAGEAEARDVSERMNLPKEYRRGLFPEYATRNDLVVRGLMSGGK